MAQSLTIEQLQTNVLTAIKDSHARIVAMVNEDLLAMNKRIDRLSRHMNKGFKEVHQRLDAVDQRLNAMDRRFDAMDRRFDSIDQRFDNFEGLVRAHVTDNQRHSPLTPAPN